MPYKEKKNRGELPQYYISQSHEPIIEPIVFELANILLKERGSNLRHTPLDSPFPRKIFCKSCETPFKFRISNQKKYWICRKHDYDSTTCGCQRIPEIAIERAFLKIFHKLRNNYETILVPYLTALEEIQLLEKKDCKEIQAINQEIIKISEQNHSLSCLMSQGIVDSALFIARIDALKGELEQLNQQKKRALRKLAPDDTTEQTEILIHILKNSPEKIREFDPDLFSDMVEKIIAYDKQSITFVLLGGLQLTERLCNNG
ncbi:MAG: zinc ribbon domain-containing protein [Eubacteriales bacterium]